MSNRVYLLSRENKQYKANLHCHTTVSDGVLTPQEMKDCYKAEGYSVVGFSDHQKMVPHPELEDEDFIPITATEINVSKPGVSWPANPTYHINFYAKDKTATTYPGDLEHMNERVWGVEGVNSLIEKANAAGFLCQINHPRWSMNESQDIKGLRDFALFEIFNTGSELGLFNGEGEYEYELYVRSGGTGSVVACDDNHSRFDRFGGWTWISAPSLSYDNIMKALENGDTYASTGPKIEELYVEDDSLHIKCSPVARIGVFSEGRLASVKRSDSGCDELTEEILKLGFSRKYIRVVIIDSKGKKAWTRAYFNV